MMRIVARIMGPELSLTWRLASATTALGVLLVTGLGCRKAIPPEQACLDGDTGACEIACARGIGGRGGCFSLAQAYENGRGTR